MIKIENVSVHGFEEAIRGMRNPMNSWDKSDSVFVVDGEYGVEIGTNDYELMLKLAKGGSTHAKYRRMITVYMDITAPLYWWKEMDTYMVGKTQNSCSTMHKIHAKEFTMDDFSHEHLYSEKPLENNSTQDTTHFMATIEGRFHRLASLSVLRLTIFALNHYRKCYLDSGDKKDWWQMIQLLPSSYNQRRTVMLNYENLAAIYRDRKDHKLDEWHEFCDMIESMPMASIITVRSR